MGLRQRGSVIGNYATASNNSASGIWTGKEAYTLQKKGTWQVPPTFSLSSSTGTVNEGSSVNFTLTTTGIPNGTVIPYTLSGTNITTTDSANNILTGNFVISNGSSTVSFNAAADVTLEGTETIQMTAAGKTANVTINDTSFPSDAQFPYTVLLLNGDGTNNAQNNTFLDSSTNNFTLTRNGNATQGAFSPYANNWSWYFDGSGDYLVSSGRANIATGEFTIETWIYPTVLNTTNQVFENANWDIGQNSGYSFYIKSTGVVALAASAGVWNTYPEIYASTGTVQANKWTHIAITRDASNVIRCFINGVLDSTTVTYSTSLNLQTSQDPTTKIGVTIADGGQYNPFTGYISNLRVVNGSGGCLYTTTFTPSTTPLTSVSNTKILACQSGGLKDNGPSNFTFTKNGDVAVKKFSPLTLSSPYSTTTFGGSGYFDGTGDSLVGPTNNTSFELYNANKTGLTIEAWIYPTVAGTYRVIGSYYSYTTGGAEQGWLFRVNNSNQLEFRNANGGVSVAGGTVPINAWSHVAGVMNGTTMSVYLNGVSVGTPTSVGSQNYSSTAFAVGGLKSDGAYNLYNFSGFISNLRVNNIAVYTGNFTPPNAPVTTSGSSSQYTSTANVNTTFTSANNLVLCNFTNAGIYDGTMISDFETVGDSKVSSTQSVFGGSSMFFDGTGDYLSFSSDPLYAIGTTEDYTVECWVNFNTVQNCAFWQTTNNISSASGPFWFGYESGALKSSQHGSGTYAVSYTWSPSTGTWYHVAATRSSGTVRLFVNGAVVTTNASTQSGIGFTQSGAAVGVLTTPAYFVGYLDDLRFTKGYARYTSAFTPPTRALAGV